MHTSNESKRNFFHHESCPACCVFAGVTDSPSLPQANIIDVLEHWVAVSRPQTEETTKPRTEENASETIAEEPKPEADAVPKPEDVALGLGLANVSMFGFRCAPAVDNCIFSNTCFYRDCKGPLSLILEADMILKRGQWGNFDFQFVTFNILPFFCFVFVFRGRVLHIDRSTGFQLVSWDHRMFLGF